MPGYEALYNKRAKTSNFMMRLTRDDTVFLAQRIKQALEDKTGVNLVFLQCRGVFTLSRSRERGKQIKVTSYDPGIRVETEMKGYYGRWSHMEMAFPLSALDDMEEFIIGARKLLEEQGKQESMALEDKQ